MAQRLRVLPINSCQSELGDHRPKSYRDPVVGDLVMAQSNVRAALAHLQRDCVVAEGIDQFAHGATDAARIEGLWNTAVLENRDDCVISSLSCALQVAERRHGKYCADALRIRSRGLTQFVRAYPHFVRNFRACDAAAAAVLPSTTVVSRSLRVRRHRTESVEASLTSGEK
jgi:hypothetical protein